jgi:hypothetical protein
MMALSRSYSKTRVVDADVFAYFTEHSHSSCLLLLNGSRVSGVWYIDSMGSLHSFYGPSVMMDNVGSPIGLLWYIDSMGSLRSFYGPSVMMDNVGSPIGLLLSTSNTEAIGMILGVLAFGWIPVVAPRRQKPS